MNRKKLAQSLTYLGTLPFFAIVLAMVLEFDFLGFSYQHLILTYGAVIVSFIAGTHWAICLLNNEAPNLFAHSNFVAVSAWISMMVPSHFSVVILIACFLYLIVLDKKLFYYNCIEEWYFSVRTYASVLVISALIICFLLLNV